MAKYEDVKQWLQKKIADGTFAVGDKIPSEHELTGLFGYSRQTIRQAIDQLEADKILIRAQGSGTYVNKNTNQLSCTATMRIGVIIAHPDHYSFPAILKGIHEVLNDCHYTISLGITYNCQTEEENALRQILANGVDGLIVESTKSALPNVNELLYLEIKNRGIPIVFFNDYYRNFEESYVIMDEERAGELAANALIRHGHKKIGGIFPSDDLRGFRRYEGIQNILKQQNLSLAGNLIRYTAEEFPCFFSGNSDSLLLARFLDVTAIICYNDAVAEMLIRLLFRHGLRVPQDISIVSFDNSPLASATSCCLTSVIYPYSEIGSCAAKLILKKISDPVNKECIILEPKLKYRSSIRNLRNLEQI